MYIFNEKFSQISLSLPTSIIFPTLHCVISLSVTQFIIRAKIVLLLLKYSSWIRFVTFTHVEHFFRARCLLIPSPLTLDDKSQ